MAGQRLEARGSTLPALRVSTDVERGRRGPCRGGGRFVKNRDSKDKVKKKILVKITLKQGEPILYDTHAAREVEGDDQESGGRS